MRVLEMRRPSTAALTAFDDDRGSWALVRAQIHRFRGEAAPARAWGDTAQRVLAAVLRETPEDGQRHALHGLALAYAGRFEEAIAEGRRAVELLPVATTPYLGSYALQLLARTYVMAGEPDRAMDILRQLVQHPNEFSAALFGIDPAFAPLKGNPRFEKLVASKH